MKFRLSQKPGTQTPSSERNMRPAVPEGAAVGGGHDAGGHADRHRHEEGAEGEDDGGLRPLGQRGGHRPIEEVGVPEVPAEDARVEGEELLVERPIQPQRLAGPLDLGGRGVGAEHDADGIAGDEVDEQEDDGDDDHHHGDDGEDATEEVGAHGRSSEGMGGAAAAAAPPASARYFCSHTL